MKYDYIKTQTKDRHWDSDVFPLTYFQKKLRQEVLADYPVKTSLNFNLDGINDNHVIQSFALGLSDGYSLNANIKSQLYMDNKQNWSKQRTLILPSSMPQLRLHKSQFSLDDALSFYSQPEYVRLELNSHFGKKKQIAQVDIDISDSNVYDGHSLELSSELDNLPGYRRRNEENHGEFFDFKLNDTEFHTSYPLQSLVGMRALYCELADKSRELIANKQK